MSDDTTGAKRPYDGWSDAQWRDWFTREVESTDAWAWLRAKAQNDGVTAYHASLKLPQAVTLNRRLLDVAKEFADPGSADFPLDLTSADALGFWAAREDVKTRFFEEWTNVQSRLDKQDASDQPASPPDDDTNRDDLDESDSADWGDQPYDVHVTLPGGAVTTLRRDDPMRDPYPEDERVSNLAEALRKNRIPLAIGVAGVIGLVLGISLFTGGDDAKPAGAVAPPTDGVAVATTGGAEDAVGTTTPVVVPATTAAPASACDVAREQDHDMQFTSADVGDGIGEEFSQRAGFLNGFLTPEFSWSGVPDAATELAIAMQWVPEDRRDAVLAKTDHWDPDEPPGVSRWVIRGIDPTSTGIGRTDMDTGLPDGVIELDHTGGSVQIDGGAPMANTVLGPDAPGRTYMFTLFALCEPELGTPFDESLGWLRLFSVDTVWFFADAEF